MGLKQTEYSRNEKDELLLYILCYDFLLHSCTFIQMLEKGFISLKVYEVHRLQVVKSNRPFIPFTIRILGE